MTTTETVPADRFDVLATDHEARHQRTEADERRAADHHKIQGLQFLAFAYGWMRLRRRQFAIGSVFAYASSNH